MTDVSGSVTEAFRLVGPSGIRAWPSTLTVALLRIRRRRASVGDRVFTAIRAAAFAIGMAHRLLSGALKSLHLVRCATFRRRSNRGRARIRRVKVRGRSARARRPRNAPPEPLSGYVLSSAKPAARNAWGDHPREPSRRQRPRTSRAGGRWIGTSNCVTVVSRPLGWSAGWSARSAARSADSVIPLLPTPA